ncbi:MAG: hypothetical protein GY841_05645 [FCB group bacterium]|nr:hypothetical protein [FCB group bacterium]
MKITSRIIIFTIIALAIISVAVAGDKRIILTVGEIIVAAEDTLAVLPVFIDSPLDSLAGVEVYFKIEKNDFLYFASDDMRDDGLLIAADTTGTILSGWEWIGVSTLDNTLYDLKISAMADWPDKKRQPPFPPQRGGKLVDLLFRVDWKNSPVGDSVWVVKIVPEKSGFSDPLGNTIGIVTSVKRVCTEYAGDSCLVWKNRRVGVLDTAAVRFKDGSIKLADSLRIKP